MFSATLMGNSLTFAGEQWNYNSSEEGMTYTQVGPADHYCQVQVFLAPGHKLVALDESGNDVTSRVNSDNRLRRVITERMLWEKIPPLPGEPSTAPAI
jgi:hypothetical protein